MQKKNNDSEQIQRDIEIGDINPWTPVSDQDRISPYNINTISIR